MLPEIDWSKPIELYDNILGTFYADADVVASGLKGDYHYVIRWSIPWISGSERVDMCSASGVLHNYSWLVRNKKLVEPMLEEKHV